MLALRIAKPWRLMMAALLLSAACASVPRSDADIVVRSQKSDARITAETQEGRALIEVFSKSGLGNAELEIPSSPRPRVLLMRFHLRGLEEFRFVYGEQAITASLSSSPEQRVLQSLGKTGTTAAVALTPGHPDWMPIRIVPETGAPQTSPLQNGYIEVEAPQSFLNGAHRHFSMHWIDFYRN